MSQNIWSAGQLMGLGSHDLRLFDHNPFLKIVMGYIAIHLSIFLTRSKFKDRILGEKMIAISNLILL